jgi:CHASE2 domain-containing sensor protein
MGVDQTGVATAPPRISILLATAALIALTVLIYMPDQTLTLLRAEHSSADLRTALFSHQIAGDHPRIAVVSITDASLPTTPIDRGFLAELVRTVDAAGAAAIGLDIFFRRPTEPAKDRALQTTLRDAHAKVVLAAWDERGLLEPEQQAFQRDFLAATGCPVGYINVQTERDGMVRYAAAPDLTSRYRDSFAVQLARAVGALQADVSQRAASEAVSARWRQIVDDTVKSNPGKSRDEVMKILESKQAEYGASLQKQALDSAKESVVPGMTPSYGRIAWLRRVDSQSHFGWLVNFDGTSPFIEVTAVDLLKADRTANAEKLAGKIVLIGADLPLSDQHRIPLTAWTGRETAGVLIHAQMLAQLLDGRSVTELALRDARMLLLALAVVGGLAGWRFRHRRFDFLSWGIATALLIGVDAVLFKSFHIILPFLMSLLAWFCGVTAGHHLGFIRDWAWSNRKVLA